MVKPFVIIFLLVCLAIPASGQSFSLTDGYFHNMVFQVFENQSVQKDINVTTSDSNVYYSSNAEDLNPPFTLLNLSNQTGVMQFTPGNDDVGLSQHIVIIVENRSSPSDFLAFQIRFNISNINNRPTKVSSSPNSIITENMSINLTILVQDIDIPYGDSITYYWWLDGADSPKLAFSGNNATYTVGVNIGDVGVHTITVVAWDEEGANVTHPFTISVTNMNIPPEFLVPIGNFSMDEDVGLINNISLDNHFNDSDVNSTNHDGDTGIQLSYDIGCEGGAEDDLGASFDDTYGNVSFSPVLDFFGNLTCWFTVFDGFATVRSNNFSVEVRPVNDAPRIMEFVPLYIYANADFTFQVNATDVENDSLRFYGDSLVLPIDLLTGILNGTPSSSDVGPLLINISVDDGILNASKILNITVLPNEIPLIFDIANQSVLQESALFVNVSAWDPLNDTLEFTISLQGFGFGVRINNTDIVYNITPVSQGLVGNHTVRVTVDDGIGRTNYTEFNLEVRDLPKDPNLNEIQDRSIRVNKTFYHAITGYDLDGNIFRFGTNSTTITAGTNSTGSYSMNASGYLTLRPEAEGVIYAVNVTLNDTQGRTDWQVVRYTITPNFAPSITNYFNITCEENEPCTGTFTGSDPNWQDTPVWQANDSYINLNPNGYFSFIGLLQTYRIVEINLTDGDLTATRWIAVNITQINDPPFFDPHLENMTEWDNIHENQTASFNITAYDEENQSCTFSVHFINFTDLQGNVTTTGISLFTIIDLGNVTYNKSVGWITFTPNSSQAGTYWANITVSDGVKSSSEVFSFVVQNINNPPSATWLLTYGAYSTSIETDINGTENTTMSIQVTATDPDFDEMRYEWWRHVDGEDVLYSTDEPLSYLFPYDDSPQTNLTLAVFDERNVTFNVTWRLFVENTNRMHWFGSFRDQTFTGGTLVNTSNTSSITLTHSGAYAHHGSYTSPPFDVGESNQDVVRFEFLNLTSLATVPAGTTLSFQTRTRATSSGNYSAWEDVGDDGEIMSAARRYIQYRAIFTSTGASTPTLRGVFLGYQVAGIAGNVGTILDGHIDLGNFFSDLDDDDTYTYSAYTTSLDFFLNASVTQEGRLRVEFNSEGTEYINVSCTDDEDNTVWSNLIEVEVLPEDEAVVPDQILVPTPSSGGGTTVQYKTRTKLKTEYVSIDIIHPGNVTLFEDDTMMVPVTIKNTGNDTLEAINISAMSENGFPVFLSKTVIESLDEGASETILLTANISEVYESFQILIRVDVADPSYTDTAKITINSLKRGRADEDLFEVKYEFAQDLLQQNPICQELSEFLIKARDKLVEKDIETATGLMDDFIDDCRYLISTKAGLESPAEVVREETVMEMVRENRPLRYSLYLIAGIVVFALAFGMYVKYRNV